MQKIINKVAEKIALANKLYGLNLSIPTVSFNATGRTAGWAFFNEWRVDFNLEIYVLNEEAFLLRTVGHEVAHLVDVVMNGIVMLGRRQSHHGNHWKVIDIALGGDGSRCHSYSVKAARVYREFTYSCNCDTAHVVKTPTHNKIQSGLVYTCRACHSPITFIQEL